MGRMKGSRNKSNGVVPTIHTPSGDKTAAEIRDNLEKYDKLQETFAVTNQALQLIDLTKAEARSYQTYNKEILRQYLKNPKTYEGNIRNLGRYLYRLCYELKRICFFNASMICGDTFNLIPLINFSKKINENRTQKKYYDSLIYWERMQFWNELTKLLTVAWREDKVCAYVYDDSDQEGGTCFYHILDNDYCRIAYIEKGVFRYEFDFSYFRTHSGILDYWDSEFKTKYNKYLTDSNLRWQEIDPERQVCFKVNADDPTMDYPPFAQLFSGIIDNLDLQEIQSVKDELSAYKLLVARLKPLSGTNIPDDFEVDVKTAIKYYNKFAEALPPYVNACISPLPIEPIEFKDLNTTEDSDRVSNGMSNLFKHIGGVILDNDKTGTTVYEAQIIENMKSAQSTLLPQVERYLNLYFDYKLGTDHPTIRYIEGVCPYTRKNKRKELIESAQNGLPTRMAIGILDGMTPLEFMSQLYLEQNILNLNDLMIPLSTSYTKSSKDVGRPRSDTDELTDEGSATREGSKNG